MRPAVKKGIKNLRDAFTPVDDHAFDQGGFIM